MEHFERTKMTLNKAEQAIVSASQPSEVAPDVTGLCYPWCFECGTSGHCNGCQACIGKSPNDPSCKHCYTIDHSSQLAKACLDATSHNRCEVCWSRTPESKNAHNLIGVFDKLL